MRFSPLATLLTLLSFFLSTISANDIDTTGMCTTQTSGNMCMVSTLTVLDSDEDKATIFLFDYWCNLTGYNPGIHPGGAFGFDSELEYVVVITTWPDGWSSHFWYAGQYYDDAVLLETDGGYCGLHDRVSALREAGDGLMVGYDCGGKIVEVGRWEGDVDG